MLKQSERAATPFLISKQPYFPLFFYVAASSFSVSCMSPASLWLSLFARLADLSPQLISWHSTFPPPFALLSSLVLFSPTFAILSPFFARTRVAPISLPRYFRPPCRFRCMACAFHFNSFTPFILFFSLIVSFTLFTGVICKRRYIGRLV